MPLLRRTRYLLCFYCSRRTSKIYDGKLRQFDCPFCEATNFLDENGQITDPPVATTDKEATPAKYAVPLQSQSQSQSQSPPSSSPTSGGAIFCDKCLKNQHLLRASLAQYLPDPDDPDYEALERDFYRFRNNQEKLYPQICADCEPRVRRRLEQAAYTAKTDVLRRMLDRSSRHRKRITSRGKLDVLDTVGRWLWVAGLVLQLCWHGTMVGSLYLESGRIPQGLGTLERLPRPEATLWWSVLTTALGVWWNPRFVQVVRGFTRHIKGVSRWYFYQAIAVAMRIVLQRTALISPPDPKLFNMQLAGHIFFASFALLIFILGPRSIRVNMAPLFEPASPPPSQPTTIARPSSAPRADHHDETRTITELLDEISNAPPSFSADPNRPPSPVSAADDLHFLPPPPRQQHSPPSQASELGLDTLHLTQRPVYPSEMDWAPTQSRHRAFNALGQRSPAAGSAFNQTPAGNRGPFWYKVPPAPITPAQRVFNPPNQPRMRKSPTVAAAVPPPVGVGFGKVAGMGMGMGQHQKREEEQTAVDFRQARFFPPVRESDPRNSLSDLLGEGLSLSQEEKERKRREDEKAAGGWFSWGGR
ncbi:Ima1 N-terminal domain-containing protein [Echria macrotheca]|uniref:Ima1 N-terminal domain-containing protein n=1 Tax=Echria macrotheca TaxID=438768 RepID=A0AAJ0BPV8_9PEZI|nr:Ima1 N-terminal domain-containing protein [Echria macrotheca]